MEKDIEFLISRLGKIEGFGDMGDSLLAVAKAKKVEDPAPPSDPAEAEKGNGDVSSNGDASGNAAKADETKPDGEKGQETAAESK